jgi:hypothetical protein
MNKRSTFSATKISEQEVELATAWGRIAIRADKSADDRCAEVKLLETINSGPGHTTAKADKNAWVTRVISFCIVVACT